MAAKQLLFLLSLFPVLTLASCTESSDKGPEDSTAAAGEEQVSQEQATTFPDSVWIAKGIPDPTRPWNSDEMGQALKVIQASNAANGPLPHYDSTGKEKTFARIASRENFTFFRDDSLSVDQRINSGVSTVAAYTQIYFLYANAAMNKGLYADELTELMGTLLKAEAEFTVLMTNFIKTVPKDRKESEQFKSGMKQMREGIAQSINGTIVVLRDKGAFSAGQLEKIALALKETAPDMLPFLDEELMAKLRTEAEKTIAEGDNETAKSVLRDLFTANQKK